MGTRSAQVGQGLAEVKTGVGTLIGFSTQPGNVATDGAGRNSPYAQALLRYIEAPGKDVSGVLIAVRNDVLKETDGKQVPWEHTSLTGQVFLRPDATASPGAAFTPPAVNYDREIELSIWNSVKDSKSPAMLETYLERYPNGNFSALARMMIDQLKTTAVPPPASGPLPGAKADEPKAATPPAKAAPSAKAKSTGTQAHPARKATGGGKAGGGGMCWGSDGPVGVLVPCTDTRARTRAY